MKLVNLSKELSIKSGIFDPSLRKEGSGDKRTENLAGSTLFTYELLLFTLRLFNLTRNSAIVNKVLKLLETLLFKKCEEALVSKGRSVLLFERSSPMPAFLLFSLS